MVNKIWRKKNVVSGEALRPFDTRKARIFYTYTYYKMKSLLHEIRQFNQEGTVFGAISKDDFERFEVVLPPYNLVQDFQNSAYGIDEKITFNQSQIYMLENLRDTLLPKLMDGAARVKKDLLYG